MGIRAHEQKANDVLEPTDTVAVGHRVSQSATRTPDIGTGWDRRHPLYGPSPWRLRLKISFWWRQPSGYFDACTRALVEANHEVSVYYERPKADAPFEELATRGHEHLEHIAFWSGKPELRALQPKFAGVAPDVVVVASWGVLRYLRAALRLPDSTLRLVAVDSPWRGSAKQWLGRMTHRQLLARAFDGVWIAGVPQWELVRRLGFQSAQTMEHVYCCDSDLYSGGRPPGDRLRSPFLFAGRLVPEKGVQQLAEAFRRFKKATGSTRRLRIVGNGPLLPQGDGIDIRPFADPLELRSLMDDSYALINPAFLEHWSVAVHEAASMGLPLVLSRSVGAGSRFLSSGVSGLSAGPDVEELAAALKQLDSMTLEDYCAMSDASGRLGSMLTLESWVKNFESGVARLSTLKVSRRGCPESRGTSVAAPMIRRLLPHHRMAVRQPPLRELRGQLVERAGGGSR